MELLASSGADMNVQDQVGWSAMQYVMSFVQEKNLRKVIPLAISLGMDPNLKNQKGVHTARFERARVAPADLESAALDHSAMNAWYQCNL